MKIRKLQIARRSVQFLALALLLAIPAVSRYANYLSARELDKYIGRWDGSPQGEALGAIDAVMRLLPDGEMPRAGQTVRNRTRALEYAQQLHGGPWSAQIWGVSLTDPLAVAESAVARKKIVPVLWLGLLVPLIATVLLGRIFCSWICPMNLLLEFTDKLRGALRFLEIRPRNLQFARATKHWLLGVGLAMAALLSVPVLGYVYPPAIISREAHDFVFGLFDRAEIGKLGFWAGGLTWMSLIIVAIALFEIAISRRWWCRYACPGGSLYSLLGAARVVRVKLAPSKCTKCSDCVSVCPVGLNPMQNEMGIECDNCGLCISHCDDDALHYRLFGARAKTKCPEPLAAKSCPAAPSQNADAA